MQVLPPRGDRVVGILQEHNELSCAELCLKLAYQETDDVEHEATRNFYARKKARAMSASVSGLLYRMKEAHVLVISETKAIKGGRKYKLNPIHNEIHNI